MEQIYFRINFVSSITIFLLPILTGCLKEPSSVIEDTFIISLLSQKKFSECSLFTLDGYGDDRSVSRILYSTQKSTYVTKYFTSNNTLDKSVRKIPEFKINLANFRRKGDMCLVVIIFIDEISSEFMSSVHQLISPVYIPITRKDEDFYIFKAEQTLHKRLLMMEFPRKIKFKIAVGSTRNFKLKISTICFFCGRRGNPKFLKFNLTNDNLARSDINYFLDFVTDFNGKILKISYPLVKAKIEADPKKKVLNAIRGNPKLLLESYMMLKFNFSYQFIVSSGINETAGRGGTGRQLGDGRWIGVVGDLMSGRADLGVPITNTESRILVVDFTKSFFDLTCLTYVTGQPSRIYSPAALLWPFQWKMWICIGICTVISFAFMFGISRLSQNRNSNWKLKSNLEFFFASFLDQTSETLPSSHSLRSFIALWLFFTLILTNIYRSKMVTLLAFPLVFKLPTTFEELAFSDYEIGFIKHGDAAYNTMKASKDQVYVKILERMEIITGTGLECLEKVVKNQKYACIGYDFAMNNLKGGNMSEAETNQIVFTPARTFNIFLGLATEGKSIIRLNFDKVLSHVRPSHLTDVWDRMDMRENIRKGKLDWWRRTNQTDKMKHLGKENDNLTLKHFAGAFYVLVVCLVVALVSFLCEACLRIKF